MNNPTNQIVQIAMDQVAGEVLAPKCVREGIVSLPKKKQINKK